MESIETDKTALKLKRAVWKPIERLFMSRGGVSFKDEKLKYV